jgi:hypothetical protein
VEKLRVGDRHHRVLPAGDDLHRGEDLGQEPGQQRELLGITAHIAGRFREAVAPVGLDVVGDDVAVGRGRAEGGHQPGDQGPGVLGPEGVDVRRFDQLLQRPADFQRIGGTAAADDQAPEPPGMAGRGEQRRRRADVRADQVRIADVPLVQDPDQELAHRRRRQQAGPPFGAPEARQVDGHQPRDAGQPRPHPVEGVQALGPRAGQHEVLAG